MTRFIQLLITISILLTNSLELRAQGLLIENRDLDGQSIKLSETDLVPSLRIEFESADNIFRSEEDVISGDRVIVNPELNWFADRRLLSLRAKYEGNFAFSSEDALSFTDHLLGLTADAEFSSKHRSRGTISLESGHQDIGTGVLSNATVSDTDEVAEFTEAEFVAAHTYGSNSARGNISGGLRLSIRDFQNLPRFTSGIDFVAVEPFATFSYRASADTRVLLGGEVSNISFDNETNDRIDTTIFTGVDFSATGKINGNFRIGATQSAFSADTRDDRTSLYLSSQLVYRPNDFSSFTLRLRREVNNSRGNLTDLESAIDTTLAAGWNRQWSSRVRTQASINIERFDAICPEPSDTVTTPSFEIEYALRRWISFGINASQETRSVSNCDAVLGDENSLFEYDRTEFGAYIRGTL